MANTNTLLAQLCAAHQTIGSYIEQISIAHNKQQHAEKERDALQQRVNQLEQKLSSLAGEPIDWLVSGIDFNAKWDASTCGYTAHNFDQAQYPHGKIGAIKEVRFAFGLGLKEAKDFVEALTDSPRPLSETVIGRDLIAKLPLTQKTLNSLAKCGVFFTPSKKS